MSKEEVPGDSRLDFELLVRCDDAVGVVDPHGEPLDHLEIRTEKFEARSLKIISREIQAKWEVFVFSDLNDEKQFTENSLDLGFLKIIRNEPPFIIAAA